MQTDIPKKKTKGKKTFTTTHPTTPSSPTLPTPVSIPVIHTQTHQVASDLREATEEMSPLTSIEEEICFYSRGVQNTCAGQAEVQ